MDRNNTNFTSPMHRRLHWLYFEAFSFNLTTAWIKDEKLLDSCQQFYDYVNDGFDDILENPEINKFDPFDSRFDEECTELEIY